MNSATDQADFLWYGVRTQTRREHIAAKHLRSLGEIEVFCPRIRYRKPTRRGPVWFVEALFPCYVFARFPLAGQGRFVRAITDVRGLVEFGEQPASLPAGVVEALRAQFGEAEEKVFDEPMRPGEEAQVVEGPFAGITALVTRVLPARERVRILLDFLGRPMEVEVQLRTLARTRKPRVLPRAGEAP